MDASRALPKCPKCLKPVDKRGYHGTFLQATRTFIHRRDEHGLFVLGDTTGFNSGGRRVSLGDILFPFGRASLWRHASPCVSLGRHAPPPCVSDSKLAYQICTTIFYSLTLDRFN